MKIYKREADEPYYGYFEILEFDSYESLFEYMKTFECKKVIIYFDSSGASYHGCDLEIVEYNDYVE